jgi:hypothetical protein
VVATAGLMGCAPKTNVSATGNVPAAYSHVYMTVQEVWFNTNATAGPDDTTWVKYPLNTPVTVDLASSMEGTLNSITTGLAVPVGTYAQVRLIPVDAASALVDSAKNLGAIYNSEVDYTDASGTLQQLPLELANPDKGIGIQTSLQVKGTSTNILSSSSSSDSSSTDSSSSSSSSGSNSTPFSLAINIDGSKDLVPFRYSAGDVNAILLNPHLSAYDTSTVGAVKGTLDVSNLTGVTSPSTSEFLDIQVTAESLSTDGTRHVAVNSTPVRADGTFTLYPLASSSSSPTSYDLVIHGPAIATVIVKGVAVNVGDPGTTTPVDIGTITPRAASSFLVNLNTTTPLQAGALVGFYQTVPGSTEVPYLVEQLAINPFTRAFDSDRSLSTANIDYGTFSSGSTVSLTTADPTEGASTYRVAATAPLFADGVLTTTVTAPGGNSTATTLVAVPTLASASGVTSIATTFQVTQSGSFDQGDLIISHDGSIVATAVLDTALQRSGTTGLALNGLPSGGGTQGLNDSALYYVSVRLWKSTDPANTLTREIFPAVLDLRSGNAVTYSLTLN